MTAQINNSQDNTRGKKMDTLYIVMPTYNEEANTESVVRSWYQILKVAGPKSRLVVADSGSTDQTHTILLRLQRECPQLEILTDTEKQHGPKVIALYKYAIENGADYIFQTDSDGQTNPDEFCKFWNQRTKYSAILGHRKVRGDGKTRAFVEKVVCQLLNLYFGVKVPDANAPFRLIKASTLERYITKIPNDYNLPNIIITAFLVYDHEPVTFEVISFKPRTAGKNSINIPKITKIGWHALGDFRQFKKQLTTDK